MKRKICEVVHSWNLTSSSMFKIYIIFQAFCYVSYVCQCAGQNLVGVTKKTHQRLFFSLQLVPAESSASDTQSQCTESQTGDMQLPTERVGGIGDSRPPSFQ
jgi:hypothetical protein